MARSSLSRVRPLTEFLFSFHKLREGRSPSLDTRTSKESQLIPVLREWSSPSVNLRGQLSWRGEIHLSKYILMNQHREAAGKN